jgi:hypothetical protein
MKVRVPVMTFAMMALVVACDKSGPVAKGANTVTAVPEAAANPAPQPAGGAPENATASAATVAPSAAATAIPAAFQGRWGLTPRDCTSSLGDAKGSLIVRAGEMRFYESRAVPTADVRMSGGVLTGDFRFTGEGQTWNKFERLERKNDTLIRTDSDPTASFTYAKC